MRRCGRALPSLGRWAYLERRRTCRTTLAPTPAANLHFLYVRCRPSLPLHGRLRCAAWATKTWDCVAGRAELCDFGTFCTRPSEESKRGTGAGETLVRRNLQFFDFAAVLAHGFFCARANADALRCRRRFLLYSACLRAAAGLLPSPLALRRVTPFIYGAQPRELVLLG